MARAFILALPLLFASCTNLAASEIVVREVTDRAEQVRFFDFSEEHWRPSSGLCRGHEGAIITAISDYYSWDEVFSPKEESFVLEVAQLDDAYVGFSFVERHHLPEYSLLKHELKMLCGQADHRGVGAVLLQRSIGRAINEGASVMEIKPFAWNYSVPPALLAFYEKHAPVVEGRQDFWWDGRLLIYRLRPYINSYFAERLDKHYHATYRLHHQEPGPKIYSAFHGEVVKPLLTEASAKTTWDEADFANTFVTRAQAYFASVLIDPEISQYWPFWRSLEQEVQHHATEPPTIPGLPR